MRAALRRPDVLVPAVLTALALALRLVGLGQSLYGDELYTYDTVVGHGLGDVLRTVHAVENTPPATFVLAWLSTRLGDPTVTLRLPSLVLGTAAVPLAYLVARRAALDRGTAALGAGLLALSPFAVFYAGEARAYAAVLASSLALLAALLWALTSGRRAAWAAFAASVAACLYSHYTTVFLLAAVVLWTGVARPGARRAVLLAAAAGGAAFLPWLATRPSFDAVGFAELFGLTWHNVGQSVTRPLAALPFGPLGGVPGPVAAVALAVAAAGALAGLATRAPRPGSPLGLLVVAALATPAGLLVYSALRTSILGPRNLTASLGPALLVLAAGLTRRRATLALVPLAVLGMGLATVRAWRADVRRPPWRDVAHELDRVTAPSDRVVQYQFFPVADPAGRQPLLRSVQIYLRRPAQAVELGATDPPTKIDRVVGGAPRVWLVAGQITGLAGVPAAPLLPGYRLLGRRTTWRAFAPVALYAYRRR